MGEDAVRGRGGNRAGTQAQRRRPQHDHLLDRDGCEPHRRAGPRDRRGPLLRHERPRLGIHDRLPGAEPGARTVRRRGDQRRVRAGVHRAAGEGQEARGVPARGHAADDHRRRPGVPEPLLHPDRELGHAAVHRRRVHRAPHAHDGRDEPDPVPDRRAARRQRAGRRDPQRVRALHDPRDRAARLEPRDHRVTGLPAAGVQRRPRDLRLRGRGARRNHRAARDVAASAAPHRLQVPAGRQLARSAHPPGPHADAARDDRPRRHQLRPGHQLEPGFAGLRAGAARDRCGVSHLHAAAGDVQRRAGDGAVPDSQPLRRPARPRRPADDHGDRRARDLPAPDPGGGVHARARDADRPARLPARRIRARLDRARVHRAVLVLVQPPVRRCEPAAHAHVLQPAAAVDPHGARDGQPRRQRPDQPRALQAVRDRRPRHRHRGRQRGHDRQPGVLPAPRAARAPGGRAHDDGRRADHGRVRGARSRGLRHMVGAGLGPRPVDRRPDRVGGSRGAGRVRRLRRGRADAAHPRGPAARAGGRGAPAAPSGLRPRHAPPILLGRMATQDHIRNFSIIAHIDHGKSTLADRILEMTHTVDPRVMRAQVLDSMDLERERGITIKAQAVRVFYTAKDGETYQFHLIDTPGHVDFTYEVSRSLAACEGALLVVDASQGVEAQTVANTYLAIDAGLELIPCLNKIDLLGAMPEEVAAEVGELIGEDPDGVRRISAKTGEGVADVLEELVARVPPPNGDPDAPPRALIFDSEFDQYRGVIAYIRMVDGHFAKGEAIRAMAAGTEADIDDIGFFSPTMTPVDGLSAGEVGYLITGLKDVSKLRVGDTLTSRANPAPEPLPGYRDVKPMVFCGLFPTDSDAFPELRDALEKLALNDAALSYEPETSDALGFGFRCGFLGLLHMDIVRERLEREYDLELLTTMPSVEYEVTMTDGSEVAVHNPSDFPDPAEIVEVREPFIRASILSPKEFVGPIMELSQERRGEHAGMHWLTPERVQINYDLPLAEIVLDFFDQLKSRTRGYASLDYDLAGMRASDLVKLDILLAGDPVDALSMVVHREKAYAVGRALADKLRARIPRQQYDVPIQAAIGAHVIARETIKAYRKDVIAKCYGGDITRKRKLLEKQKAGKRRMKQVGRIEVPQEAFLAVLELGKD